MIVVSLIAENASDQCLNLDETIEQMPQFR
jgi:hypothetical protein